MFVYFQITEFNMTIDQVTKHNDVLSEENAVLRVGLCKRFHTLKMVHL